MKQYLVYDLGGTFIKFALMNEDYEILEQDKVPSPTDTMEHLLDVMKEIADRFEGRFEAAAVSMPGRIDTSKGMAYTGGAYHFIKDAPMADLLSEKLGCRVVIGNDGKCAAKALTCENTRDAAFGDEKCADLPHLLARNAARGALPGRQPSSSNKSNEFPVFP